MLRASFFWGLGYSWQRAAEADERLTVPRKPQVRVCGLPFATTTYEADHDGVLRALLPSRCVFATGAQTCSIFVDHYRLRKSGPCYPVAVIGCMRHPYGRYTLYPPGHFPYGRRPLVAYHPTGQLMVDPETGRPAWKQTLFAAALDAAKGEGWPTEQLWYRSADPRRRQTQGRALQFAGQLMGVHPELSETVRKAIATRLTVATMTLFDGARRWARRWKPRGAAILAVLIALPTEISLLDRLLAAGATSGLWRQPCRWDSRRMLWIKFCSPGSTDSEHSRAACCGNRGPPPTKVIDPAGS